MMQENIPQKVKISQIVRNQVPEYFLEGKTNFPEFLEQYYLSQEYQGSPLDILENINFYTSPQAFSATNLTENTTLEEELTYYDKTISVTSTLGWPKSYGLLKIDKEIITYTGITSTSFTGCIRGFCGVESFNEIDIEDNFVFIDTVSASHTQGSTVENLSNLFLRKFFEDFRYQYTPGFENVDINSEINTANLTQYARDFYRSKGTDKSFKILFDILFGVDISITKPATQLFTPSDGQWVENRFLIVEDLTGDIRKISKGVTLRQDARAGTGAAQGIVYYFTDIPRQINGKFYSRIGFDLETLSGRFSNTAVTKVSLESPVGSTSLVVDSTVGFPENGKLFVKTVTGVESFKFTSKTSTQFLGCVGLGSTSSIGETLTYGREIYEDNLLYGTIEGQTKYFAVSNILSGIKNQNTRYLSPEDKINIKSFGYTNSIDPIFTKWIHNVANKYEVSSYDILSQNQSRFVLDNYTNIFKGDVVGIVTSSPGSSSTYITDGVVNSLTNGIILEFDTSRLSGVGTDYVFLRKKISTSSSNLYSGVSNYVTNVQNTYTDNVNVYTATSCLPDYEIKSEDNSKQFVKTSINTTTFTINIPNHNYYSGELVYYECLGNIAIDNLVSGRKYFIKKVDANNISLCYNKSSVYKNSVIEISYSSTTSDNHKLTISTLYDKNLTSQNLLKKFPIKPKTGITKDKTPGVNGGVGLFLNGVEALDSKSEYNVYYGPIENILVKNSLDQLDVINPPILIVEDENGSGIQAHMNLFGSIKEVFVDDRGFRFLEDPRAKVVGGNGTGAILDVRTTTYDQEYSLEFSATSSGIDTTSDYITFTNNHNLITGDNVIYSPNNQTSPGVLRLVGVGTTTVGIGTTLSEINNYYVGVVSEKSIKLHYSNIDAVSGINTVDFISHGDGNQILTLNEPIGVIGDIRIVNQGFNYQNKKIYVDSQKHPPEDYLQLSTIRTGINTFDHYIFAKDHRFSTGDLVEYSFVGSGTSISGITTNTQYYVLKLDNDKFRLANSTISVATTSFVTGVGIVTQTNTTSTRQFLDQQKYLKFSSVGVGTHIFKYPDIVVEVSGLTAAGNTTLYQRVKCLGEIESIFVYKGGTSYGTEDIFNFEKQPKITISSGSGAKINPVINSDGNIVDYVIKRGGSNYVGIPEIIVSGVGTGAVLKPTVANGVITSVNILEQGTGYSSGDTKISVVPIGYASSLAASFKTNIKSWSVNAFELHKKEMTSSDDGVILESLNKNYGNRYVNYTLPRELRVKLEDNITKTNNGYTENASPAHSPIVGWAYDGNPIYGPYGYSSPNSASKIKRIVPGYTKLVSPKDNRPSTSVFPLGFFNDDYEFVNTGDLDEHNGRFGITPEFPNGTYAYFCPISDITGSGGFQNSREPVYPYIIGNTFRNEVDNSNFTNEWNKSLLESKNTNLFKNLSPYNSNTYEFLDLTTSPKENIFNVKSIATSGNRIDSINIVNPGIDYKVGEFIRFDETGTGGSGCEAYISSVVGKAVTSVVGVNTYFYNVKFDYQGTKVTGMTSVPHNLSTGDVIKLNSIRSDDEIPENDTTDSVYFKELLGLHLINVPVVTSGIVTDIPSYTGATSGFTTFIELTQGNLNAKFQIDDVVGIKSEQMLILNVDDVNDRLRVLRGYNPLNPNSPASSGAAYTTGDTVELKPIKFSFELPPRIRLNKPIVNRRNIFFDPTNSVGLGTTGTYATYTVGAGGSTSNQRRRFIKEQRIYLPNHGLETGDKLLYNPGPGIAMSVSVGVKNDFVVAVSAAGTVGVSTSFITGINTTGIIIGHEVGVSTVISTGTTVTSIGIGTIGIGKTTLNTSTLTGFGFTFGTTVAVNLTNVVGLGTTVFAINRGKNHIGLSTTRVGLGSADAGLYFVNVGDGEDHAIITDFGESLIGDVQKSYAIVSVGESHGLSEGDQVSLELIPNQTITKVVKFDTINKELIVGIATVASTGITTGSSGSAFTLNNHELENGSKIVYQSNSPALPLVNNAEYYVLKVNDNQFRLSESLYGARNSYEFIGLSTSGVGIHTISYINPKIDIVKGNTLKFDLSNSSLSDFELKFYEDKNFENEFVGTGTYFANSQFETEYVGTPGTSGAYASIKTSTIVPNTIYYSIRLRDISRSENVNKIDFYPDTEVPNYNKIVLKKSDFNITGIAFDTDFGTNNFKISILPENTFETGSYTTTTTSTLKYTTTSKTAKGSIDKVEVSFGGVGYLTLPTIESIRTTYGDGAQLSINSNKIGSINRYEVYNPTFELPSDYTVKPILDFPITLKVKDNFTLASVGVSSGGNGYVDAPTPVAIDEDGNIISGLLFESELTAQTVSKVNIIDNRNDLNKNFTIVSTNNGNGYIIETASFNAGTKTATLFLDLNLSSETISGIETGTKIFVEGLESYSGVSTTTSYNSSTNQYKAFAIVGVNSSSKTVDYLIETGNPGTINPDTSNGFMIFESSLAKFTPRFRQGSFLNGEVIDITKSNGSSEKFVCTPDNGWNGKVLKVRYKNQFSEFVIEVGDTVFGNLSLQNGKVDYINTSSADSVIDFSYVNSIGWEKDYGKLSVSNQKLSDNVYYQKMSYDIKTTISPTEWKSTVDSLNHTSGFKSFGSVIIVSEPQV